MLMHTYESDIHVTPLPKFLAMGLNPVLVLHCPDPFLPSSLGNSLKSIKTNSLSFPKPIITAISATAHYIFVALANQMQLTCACECKWDLLLSQRPLPRDYHKLTCNLLIQLYYLSAHGHGENIDQQQKRGTL